MKLLIDSETKQSQPGTVLSLHKNRNHVEVRARLEGSDRTTTLLRFTEDGFVEFFADIASRWAAPGKDFHRTFSELGFKTSGGMISVLPSSIAQENRA